MPPPGAETVNEMLVAVLEAMLNVPVVKPVGALTVMVPVALSALSEIVRLPAALPGLSVNVAT